MMEHVRAPNFEIVTKMNTCPKAPDNPNRSRTGPVEYTICRRRTWQGKANQSEGHPKSSSWALLDPEQHNDPLAGYQKNISSYIARNFSGTPHQALKKNGVPVLLDFWPADVPANVLRSLGNARYEPWLDKFFGVLSICSP